MYIDDTFKIDPLLALLYNTAPGPVSLIHQCFSQGRSMHGLAISGPNTHHHQHGYHIPDDGKCSAAAAGPAEMRGGDSSSALFLRAGSGHAALETFCGALR